jgi:hypothetical protein
VASGETFHPGDRLRFVVDLPFSGHVNVLGVEASGKLYVAWPIAENVPTLREVGMLQELPGALGLDASSGREMLYLVECPVAVGPPAIACQVKSLPGASAPLVCPSGCLLTPFVLHKSQE